MKPLAARLLVGCMALTSGLCAEETLTFREALTGGNTAVGLKYRFENVSEDAFEKDGRASTLRTVLNYRTAAYKGFSVFMEAQNVADLGAANLHNNGGAGDLHNGVTDRPVIADPAQTVAQQVYLRWEGGRSHFDLGRQELIFGDQRFVGPVGWRQNHQTFDAVEVESEPHDKIRLQYAFIDTVIRLNGQSKPMATHALNVEIVLPFGAVTPYVYLLDYEDPGDAGLSTSTFGLELKGAHEMGAGELAFGAEYASQADAGDNPSRVDADYWQGSVGWKNDKVGVQVTFEALSGSAEDGKFTTPLATLHAFNGWADKFLATPDDGLEDLAVELSGKVGKTGWKAIYHDFSAEGTSASYGTEVDLQLLFQTPWHGTIGLSAALYREDGFSTDTDKVWLWTQYSF